MHNLITDIPGLLVGNTHDEQVVSGVTAIIIDQPNAAACSIRGGAPGSRDTALLALDKTLEGVDAVVLSGGSAFGLDAAGGVMSVLRTQGKGLSIGTATVPIVVQAITFDLLNGGDKAWDSMPPYWALGERAAQAATDGAFDLGSVGGGYGASTATFKGGLGSASAVTSQGHTIGAIVVVNAIGSAVIGDGPHFWAAPFERDQEFGGRGLPAAGQADATVIRTKHGAPPSTTIALVATDADLTKAEAKRLAVMADDGLARALRPVHAPMDGDTVFAVSTKRRPLSTPTALTEIGTIAADCLARAIARAVYEAVIPSSRWQGPPAYRDQVV